MSTLPIYEKLENKNELECRLMIFESLTNKHIHRINTQTGYTYICPKFSHLTDDGFTYEFPLVVGYVENSEAYMIKPDTIPKLFNSIIKLEGQ